MSFNDPTDVREVVVRAIAEVQRRPVDYYDGKGQLVVPSCDVAAAIPMIEVELGCEPILPGDFAGVGGVGHSGLCYDPMDDVPIDALCGVVERVASLVGSRG